MKHNAEHLKNKIRELKYEREYETKRIVLYIKGYTTKDQIDRSEIDKHVNELIKIRNDHGQDYALTLAEVEAFIDGYQKGIKHEANLS